MAAPRERDQQATTNPFMRAPLARSQAPAAVENPFMSAPMTRPVQPSAPVPRRRPLPMAVAAEDEWDQLDLTQRRPAGPSNPVPFGYEGTADAYAEAYRQPTTPPSTLADCCSAWNVDPVSGGIWSGPHGPDG